MWARDEAADRDRAEEPRAKWSEWSEALEDDPALARQVLGKALAGAPIYVRPGQHFLKYAPAITPMSSLASCKILKRAQECWRVVPPPSGWAYDAPDYELVPATSGRLLIVGQPLQLNHQSLDLFDLDQGLGRERTAVVAEPHEVRPGHPRLGADTASRVLCSLHSCRMESIRVRASAPSGMCCCSCPVLHRSWNFRNVSTVVPNVIWMPYFAAILYIGFSA